MDYLSSAAQAFVNWLNQPEDQVQWYDFMGMLIGIMIIVFLGALTLITFIECMTQGFKTILWDKNVLRLFAVDVCTGKYASGYVKPPVVCDFCGEERRHWEHKWLCDKCGRFCEKAV